MSETEIVEVVDGNNFPLFEKPLGECLKEGLLHRVVAVFLKDSSGRLFLQRRSFRDDWMPGKWTCSCAGHVKAGETPKEAARRELGEELGLEISAKFLFRYLLPRIEYHGLVEHEISFVFETQSDSSISLDPREVEEGKFLRIDEAKDFFKNNSEEITPDAVILCEKYLKLENI